MYKLIYSVAFVLVVQLVLFSCKNQRNMSISHNTIETIYFPTNTTWYDSLKNSSEQVKDALIKFYGKDLSRINNRFNLSLSKEEYDKLKVISVETYKIDSADIKGLRENSSINKILKLAKTEAQCYMMKDSDIILFMEQYLEKGQWKVTEIGRIFEDVGDQIETLYFKENIKVHNVIINDDRYGKKKFIVFVRNGQYISIEHGKEVPLLQKLLEFKKNIESGLIF